MGGEDERPPGDEVEGISAGDGAAIGFGSVLLVSDSALSLAQAAQNSSSSSRNILQTVEEEEDFECTNVEELKKKDGEIGRENGKKANGKKANGKMERPPMGPPLGNRNREANGQFIKATGRDLKRMGRMEMDDMY
jgi:hypothetical protein